MGYYTEWVAGPPGGHAGWEDAMDTKDRDPVAAPELNERLRAIYDDAAEQLKHLFKTDDDWVGSSIDYVALRMVHERYPELTAEEVRELVTAIAERAQHGVEKHRLTSLYP